MARWWDTDMASASQALYSDPSMAFSASTIPDKLLTGELQLYSQEQEIADKKRIEQERSGFMGTISGFFADADEVLSKIPGWGITKQYYKALFYPVDKAAGGAHWLYSNIISQPLSTLMIQEGKAMLGDPDALLSADEWSEAYGIAEHQSPGQSVANIGAATGTMAKETGSLPLFQQRSEESNRIADRMIRDTDYWRDKAGWKYTAGTGASDFAMVVGLDPSTYLLAGAGQVMKGVRSVQLAEKGGELVRTRGAIADTTRNILGKEPETVAEVSNGQKMNDFFDWVAAPSNITGAPRKTAAEIEMHPIWGRGRRQNNFKYQYSQVLSTWAREDMPLAYRFMAGDNAAAGELATRGEKVLDDIGRLTENRVFVENSRLDPELLNYFAMQKLGLPGAVVPAGTDLALPLTRETALHEEVAAGISKLPAAPGTSPVDLAAIKGWKESKLNLINGEVGRLQAEELGLSRLLEGNLGRKAEDFSAIDSTGFGGLPRAYRMGNGSFSSVAGSAERKFANKMAARKGRFTTEGVRKGFYGTPLRVIQSFGDKTPVGRVNHNEADAGDRVYEMIREVPGLNPEQRSNLLNRYMTAGDKTAKSRELGKIQAEVIDHMARNVHGLDGEISRIVTGMVAEKVDETVSKLLSTTKRPFVPGKQAFSSAKDEATGRTVDYVEDGVGYIVAPLAKTQLSQTDTLLPVVELNRVFSRASGSMRTMRSLGGSAVDTTKLVSDSFNTIWKATTLLRPAYVPRMISEEALASAVKFGFMSRIASDSATGMKNFTLNRAQQAWAELGRTSYTPSTGKGTESIFSVVRIGDDSVRQAVKSRQQALQKELSRTTDPLRKQTIEGELGALRLQRIRVNKALPVIDARIKMERELMTNLERDLAEYQGRHAAIAAGMKRPPTLGGGPGSASKVRSANRLTSLQDKIDGIVMQIDDHKTVLDEFTDYYNEVVRASVAATGRRLGEGSFEAFGYTIPQAFSKEWLNPIPRDQVSSDSAMAAMYARGEAVDVGRGIRTGSWTYIKPDESNHMNAWLHALNRQFAQDDLFNIMLQDSSGAMAREWLGTPAGKQHLRDLGIRARDPEKLLEDIRVTLDKYLPEDTGLRARLADGEDLTAADLQNAIARSDFPTVHGEEIADKMALTAKDSVANMVDRIVEKGFQRLGSIPSDVLSRHPTYIRFQEGRYKEILGRELSYRKSVGREEAVNPKELEKILQESDRLARKDMSQIVYDPQRTTASEALRFVSPFFSAHADGLARWGGLVAEQPELLGKIARIYNAPVSANMVTDAQGNSVGKDGYVDVRDPSTGEFIERKFVPMSERVLQLRAPWKDESEGSYPIRISAMNTILPGDPWFNPGSGPIVQIAGSQIAKASPQTGDFLQWAKILPYGPSSSTVDAVLPKYMRTMWDAYKGDDPDNEEYQKAYLAIWNKKVMEYHSSGGEMKFSQKDIENEAKQFLFLNVLEAWGSPAQSSNTPLTGTPYQFYVDQLNQMKKIDPENANDMFLAKFGTDYAGFTASLTKSMGIAATVSADQMAEKYADEIAADPDMAKFWIGNVYNGGPFSSSVYQKQLSQSFGGEEVRERITAESAIERTQASQGWSEYKAAKGLLDAMLIRNGFRSYTQKGAENLNLAKQQLIAGIGQQYPAWREAFGTIDRSKVPTRIEFFERAVQDERLANDPLRYEMGPLAEYLVGRQQFKAALQARGLQQLSYGADGLPRGQAADIGYAWDQFKMGLINSNTAFGDLHNRYLSNDDLQ